MDRSPPPRRLDRLRGWASALKRDLFALTFALRDPRTPWVARLLAGLIVLYAASPIDLIPDAIPVLGLLDELILLPLAIALVRRWIPDDVWAEAKVAAGDVRLPRRWIGVLPIAAIWVLVAWALSRWMWP